MEIYQPSDDSYFFTDFLKEYFKKNIINSYLDMGSGSGIFSEVALKFIDKKNILAADINPSSIKLLKQKGFDAVKTNLFEKIETKFDLITFNAPYLPLDSREPKSDRKSTRLNSSHIPLSRMPSSA